MAWCQRRMLKVFQHGLSNGVAFEEDYYDCILKEMSGDNCSYVHCPMDKLDEIKIVLEMARGNMHCRQTDERRRALKEVEKLIKRCSTQEYIVYYVYEKARKEV